MSDLDSTDNITVSHYEHAPITEAIIDIQFRGPNVSPEELEALQPPQADRYPEKQPFFMASIQLAGPAVGELPSFTAPNSSLNGWAFITANKLQVWQTRPGGFTFSRLAPYQSWQPFQNEARRLWELTRIATRPEAITRIAVRYVNRLELPLPFSDFKEYLRTFPEVSPSLPQGLATFFMQLHIPQFDIESMAVLNLHLLPVAPEPPPKFAAVILDLDLFKEKEIPQNNDDELWRLFEQLHSKKNEIFESCITERTRDLIR